MAVIAVMVLALHWLLEDAHVTRAARHLGTSQPAMSRTLGELQDWFGDPLLVRVGRRMVLTPFAESLRPRLSTIIAELREIVRPPEPFRAETARGSVRVALRVGGFLLAGVAVSRSDCVATLPSLLPTVAGVELARIHPPLALAAFTLEFVWHARSTAQLRHRFVRESLQAFGKRRSGLRGRRRG